MTPEGKIAAYLVRKVKEYGGHQRKVEWSGRTGAPDRLVMLPHVSAFVELKAPGKEPEPHQAREIKRMRESGLRVYVADSYEAIDEMINELYLVSSIRTDQRGWTYSK